MDPLSLLCRLAAAVPPPRLHTVKYAGVLASARAWRSRPVPGPTGSSANDPGPRRPAYRPWAELLKRAFEVDVLACPRCHGRMRLLALVQERENITRLAALGEATEVPRRSPGRGPPFWKSRILRRVCGEDDAQPLWGDLPA